MMNQNRHILALPAKLFDRIHKKPIWRLAFVGSSGCIFLLVWLGGCWRDLSQALEWPNLIGPALISPLIVGMVSLGTTALIYLLNMIWGGHEGRATNFKTLYSVNIHCGVILLLGEVVNFLLVRTNIIGDRPTPLRGRFPVGLDMLLLGVDDPNLYLSVILHSTSVFLIWYLIVLSLGIRTVTGMSQARATAIATTLWCALVLLALGMVYAAGGSTTVRIRF